MENKALKINEWRGCVEKEKANCPYVGKNEYDVWCCTIDHIVQVEWYGCRPSEIIAKVDRENSV